MSVEPPNFDAHVGKRLSQLRTERKLSVAELSDRSGLAAEDIQSFEHGKKRIKPDDLWELSKFFGVDVGDFFDGLPSRYSGVS